VVKNFRDPDLGRKNFSGGLDIKGTYKKLISTPVDIALQTVKNSGPSERKAVQAQICSYI
jgi:hypothetical protein